MWEKGWKKERRGMYVYVCARALVAIYVTLGWDSNFASFPTRMLHSCHSFSCSSRSLAFVESRLWPQWISREVTYDILQTNCSGDVWLIWCLSKLFYQIWHILKFWLVYFFEIWTFVRIKNPRLHITNFLCVCVFMCMCVTHKVSNK